MRDFELRITIIGAFAFDTMDTGGQPVKTRELYYALVEKYGTDRVRYLDTKGWKKEPIKCFFMAISLILWSNRCVMLPAENGLKLFSRMLRFFKSRDRKVYYDVIGGWIANHLKKDNGTKKSLFHFDGIWVETKTLERELVDMGFQNVHVVKNFKKITILKEHDRFDSLSEPFKLCTFSRVIEEKGISDAISAVSRINLVHNRKMIILDVYGPIGPSYMSVFTKLVESNCESVNYRGVADPNNSVEVLKEYCLLLFPTKYYTEGIPGTIIDAYAAGVPVIASQWESWSDVISNNETGVVYEFGNENELFLTLESLVLQPKRIVEMRQNCISEAQKYTREAAMLTIERLLR